jgi:hemerythrin superfamily protein
MGDPVPDVVEMIMQDHREVERMFEELKGSPEKRAGLVPVLVTLLTAHSRAEESEVYPVARDEAGIADDVEHSQEEHLLADKLLARLADTDPESPGFDDALSDLVEAVTHHVEEEESKVLPGMRSGLSEERLNELAGRFGQARSQHLGETPDDMRKSELQQQADNLGLDDTRGKTKGQLESELAQHAEE